MRLKMLVEGVGVRLWGGERAVAYGAHPTQRNRRCGLTLLVREKWWVEGMPVRVGLPATLFRNEATQVVFGSDYCRNVDSTQRVGHQSG